MHTIVLKNGKEFSAKIGETLLNAATRQSINLNYSCANGRCGSCKCKLVNGNTYCVSAEIGLTEKDKAEGYILTCARAADSRVLLDTEELSIEVPSPKTYPCRIDKITPLTSDTLEVRLRLPPITKFSFFPGQYIDVIGPNGVRRSYSIANAPNKQNHITLNIRAVKNGIMSNYWFAHAKPNDLLHLFGPLGTFFLRNTLDVDLIFLATGTGIAPVKAILESLVEKNTVQPPRSITVAWGGRVKEDLYFNMESLPVDLKFIPVLSRANTDWSGYRGYVQQALLDTHPSLSNATVYACGSETMINSAKDALTTAGLPSNRFYSDAFVPSDKLNQ